MPLALRVLAVLFGLFVVQAVLRDAFETVVLPRRPSQRRRITILYYRLTWPPVRRLVRHLSPSSADTLLNYFGPLWMLGLVSFWAGLLILAFAFIGRGLGSPYHIAAGAPPTFLWDLYVSGTTLFTLGMGDIYPLSTAARVEVIVEAGVGLSLLALVIGYIPVLYTAFSRREVMVSLLDARAGSPPSAMELLRRSLDGADPASFVSMLAEFERWGAELLELYLSYPVLMYYRSQHDRQSWLAALVAVADACALLLAAGDKRLERQAGFTFAVLRHLLVDVTPYMNIEPHAPHDPRLRDGDFDAVEAKLASFGVQIEDHDAFAQALRETLDSYEAYANGIGEWLLTPMPPLIAAATSQDDWRVGA
jgi:hypothetical protein